MNKNDLIQKLADTTGLAKNDAAKAVDGRIQFDRSLAQGRR